MSDDIILGTEAGNTIRLSPRRMQALFDLADSQIQIDEARVFTVGPTAEERDEAMHGSRVPIQDGAGVLFPIACRLNEMRLRSDEAPASCRWVADDSGIPGSVACTTCGKAVGPGIVRHAELRALVDGTYTPAPARRVLNDAFFRPDGESEHDYRERIRSIPADKITVPIPGDPGAPYVNGRGSLHDQRIEPED